MLNTKRKNILMQRPESSIVRIGELSPKIQAQVIEMSYTLNLSQNKLYGLVTGAKFSKEKRYVTLEDAGLTDIVLCLIQEDTCIGYIGAYKYTDLGVSAFQIRQLFISPNARGKGFGSKLVDAIVELAKNENINYITIGALANNPVAIKLYKRLGFSETMIQMAKPLK